MSPDAVTMEAASACGDMRLLPIPLSTLSTSATLCVDLYVRPDKNGSPVLYRERKLPISSGDYDRLSSRGVRVVYMPAAQALDYQTHLRENLDRVLACEDAPAVLRYEFLSEAARNMLAEPFQAGRTDRAVCVAADLAGHMVEMISRDDMAPWDVLSILRHDYHTFSHSFNVASYCLLLAKALAITELDALAEVALGGLLHDVGKVKIPFAVLSKNGPLTVAERNMIERHPTLAFERLCDRNDLSWGQLMMVYQHHERVDGSGYPVGLVGEEIHELARLCGVVDAFEALINSRPYRGPVSVSEALEYQWDKAGVAFDREMARCFRAIMARS